MDSENGDAGQQPNAGRKLIFGYDGHAMGLADGRLFGTLGEPTRSPENTYEIDSHADSDCDGQTRSTCADGKPAG